MKTQNVKFNAEIKSINDAFITYLVKIEDENFDPEFFFNVELHNDEIYAINNENEDFDSDTKADFDTEEFKAAFAEAYKKSDFDDVFSFTAEIELAD